MVTRFEPIYGRTAEIIEALMASDDMPLSDDLRFKLRLCIEEMVNNIVSYAYDGGKGWVEVSTDLTDGSLTITLKDEGVAFNPLAKDDPDITLSAEDRQIGGLGIYLCKQLMDHLEYERLDGCNIFRMTRNLDA